MSWRSVVYPRGCTTPREIGLAQSACWSGSGTASAEGGGVLDDVDLNAGRSVVSPEGSATP